MKPLTEKFKRQRKFLLVLPLLALPFVTLTFWALRGGQGTKEKQSAAPNQGFNTRLPTASVQAGKMDKMSLYNLAERDSQALREARAQDPYAGYMDTPVNREVTGVAFSEKGRYTPSYPGTEIVRHDYQDPNELKVQRKLKELEKVLNASHIDTDVFAAEDLPAQTNEYNAATSLKPPPAQLVSGIPDENQPDPELQQLNGMLEKILDIQHP